MNKKKILSLIMALVMLVGVFSPLTAFAGGSGTATQNDTPVKKEDMVGDLKDIKLSDTKPKSTTLTIHKLVADKYNTGVPVDHNGGTLTPEQLVKLGTNVKGLPGVKFTIYKIDKAEDFTEIKNAKPKTTEAMKTYVDNGKATLLKQTDATGADGSVSEKLADGNYWIIESERPSRVNSSLAVPFAITLPLLNQVKVGDVEAGTKYMETVHVYPKNTEKKPEMDKYFDEPVEGTESSKLTENHTMHPDYQKYLEKKETIDARVGSKVPYEVKTSLKAGQKYTILSWSDIMTTGLKYDQGSLQVTYKDNENVETTVLDLKSTPKKQLNSPSANKESDFGFDLTIKDEATIKAINEALAKGDVEFTLKYTATLTNDAVVDLPESNNITFTPGEPTHENDQKPVNPTNGELTVTKTWADGTAPENVLVTYILFEGDSPIASVTLNKGKIESSSLPEGVTVTNTGYNVTFKGLDNEKTYKIEEFANGYDPQYTAGNAVTNKVNPDTITPTPPQVETYGKKFVKTDDTDKKTRLAGAEFKVKNGNGTDAKYLVAKTYDKIAAEAKAVTTAKDALDKAVEAYNNLDATAQTDDERAKVTAAQEAYNAAVKEAGKVYEWGKKENAITLVSNGQGQFEITGLAEGTYYLEETKAPKGFGKLTEDVKFTVDKDSYTKNGDINYKKEDTGTTNDAQQVINKNLTIPQTGGMGTVLFTVVGIGLMAGAVMAMKRNREEA